MAKFIIAAKFRLVTIESNMPLSIMIISVILCSYNEHSKHVQITVMLRQTLF